MTSTDHFLSDVRDISFNLFEVLPSKTYLGTGPFSDFNKESSLDILREIDRFARGPFAESFADADRNPPKLVDGQVEIPDSLKKSIQEYYDAGWHLMCLSESLGGYDAPHVLRWATAELLVGANPAAFLYVSGTLMAEVLAEVATPEQIAKFAIPIAQEQWGATMVLTEADAGSDVGAGTTKATYIKDDMWNIEGVKRFITSGDNDFYDNIIHLVLARRVDGETGTKGLSMFIVPKFLIEDDGTIGSRNGVGVAVLEDKMGIKGSTTCELTFGINEPCVGYLVGNVHEGIRQMFHVIEGARMLIGVKSTATASTGHLNALQYAQERIQSSDLTQARDKTAPKVPIIAHPAVRRMLMDQKAYVEGMRVLVLYTASLADQAILDPENSLYTRLQDLMLPLVKGYCSEKGYQLLAQSLQVYGGSGYVKDYPIEQYIRDAKIDTIYEGTTAIQGLDLFFRKIARDQGATLMEFSGEIMKTLQSIPDEFLSEKEALEEALSQVQTQVMTMVTAAMSSVAEPTELYKVGLHTNSLLESLAEVTIAWLMLQQAIVAHTALAGSSNSDIEFYQGKIAGMRWFFAHALPQLKLRAMLAAEEDNSIMLLPPTAL